MSKRDKSHHVDHEKIRDLIYEKPEQKEKQQRAFGNMTLREINKIRSNRESPLVVEKPQDLSIKDEEIDDRDQQNALKRTKSLAPTAFFVNVGEQDWILAKSDINIYPTKIDRYDTDMVQFSTTFDNIKTRTNDLHKKLEEKKQKYINTIETACVAWSIRALGLIDDDFLEQSRDIHCRSKKGILITEIAQNLNEYLDNELSIGIFFMNIDSVFGYLEKESATLITIKLKEEDISHVILAIKTSYSCILYLS
jgi:hypothetical protein